MILLVKYNGIRGGLVHGIINDFEIIDSAYNLDNSVYELLKRHTYSVLFDVKIMSALAHHGFFYITGGTPTYKLSPLLLINNNHRFFRNIKQ